MMGGVVLHVFTAIATQYKHGNKCTLITSYFLMYFLISKMCKGLYKLEYFDKKILFLSMLRNSSSNKLQDGLKSNMSACTLYFLYNRSDSDSSFSAPPVVRLFIICSTFTSD